MIAKPFSPGNAFPAEEVARERIDVRQGDDRLVHQRQLRRSAVGGAGAAWRRARTGLNKAADGVRGVPRLRRRRAADRAARSAARRRVDRRRVPRGRRRDPRSRGAAPASARAPTRSTKGQRAITSFNRNWQNRMGLGGEGYLASPVGRRRVGAGRLHGAAERVGFALGSG